MEAPSPRKTVFDDRSDDGRILQRIEAIETEIAELRSVVSSTVSVSQKSPAPTTRPKRTAHQERENLRKFLETARRIRAGDMNAEREFFASGGWTPSREWYR
jgi:hypothetical protein